jgi:hypothetical protein
VLLLLDILWHVAMPDTSSSLLLELFGSLLLVSHYVSM